MAPATLNHLLLVAEVALDSRTGGTEAIYTYRATESTKVGEAYMVPLGSRTVMGYVVETRETPASELGFPESRLRALGAKIEHADLPETTIDTIKMVAEQYLCPLPMALGLATPPGVREKLVTEWTLVDNAATDLPLTAMQEETLRVLKEQGGKLVESKTRALPPGSKKALQHLRSKGLVRQRLAIDLQPEKHRLSGMLRLTPDEAKVERFLTTEAKKKPAQALTLMRLQGAGDVSFSVQEVKALSEVTDQTIRALLQAGLLEKVDGGQIRPRTPPTPNLEQQAAIDAVVASIQSGKFEPFLLFGITGSGKTEVFLRCAAEALRRGKQVLFLVPEIALTAQVIAQLRERFGRGVAVLHSNLPANERLDNWMKVKTGEASVVLGTRSALFAPVRHLGLIVMDEEHEQSYKQENPPRYHAKIVARFLARRFSAPLLLGSATPSVETFHEAERGGWRLLTLSQRAAGAKLPTVHIEDMTQFGNQPRIKVARKEEESSVELEAAREAERRKSLFCPELQRRMIETLAAGKQTILFLNRRAYAPFLMCRDCAHVWKCDQCAVTLSYHRRDGKLRCHHCGFNSPPPDVCPKCDGTRIKPFGAGVERVEEAVQELLPEATIARLDRDIARKRGALEQTIALFRAGEIDVLVGTQMVAKGLDFPNVTLVGVVAADIALNMPDFRASERAFQLLSQVAGRAGRGVDPGHVVVQTFSPKNIAVVSAKSHDFLSFFGAIREERRQALYPPFSRLLNITLTGEDRPEVLRAGLEVRDILRGVLGVEGPPTLLGPVDCALERLQGRWRRHLLLKLTKASQIQEVGRAMGHYEARNISVSLDVDPYSLM
ncbi:MAG: primosomal protein N' [Fimbriimonadaceae bacterium]|nr:primosomal protein N' [Fimbriimonadaceae bacterium]